MHPAGAPAAPPPAPPTGELAWVPATPAAERGRGPCRQPLPGVRSMAGGAPCRPIHTCAAACALVVARWNGDKYYGPAVLLHVYRCAAPAPLLCASVVRLCAPLGASLAPPAALPRAGGWWTAGTRPPPGAWPTSTTRPSSGGEAGGSCCAWAGMVGCVTSRRLVPRWQRRGEGCSRGSAVLDQVPAHPTRPHLAQPACPRRRSCKTIGNCTFV